jgi:signal transduction histidine kinase
MLQMVDDLLDITTIESGKLQLNIRPTDLKEVTEYDISLKRVLASRKHIDLIFHCDKDIPMVMVDESKIKQVLSNLIGNAIKFSYPESKVEVFLDIKADHVVVSVKDEGQGVPAEESDKIFRPFARTSVREPDGEKSSGLGLAIARRIVEGHKGKIWFDSEAGRGSTFYFSIPINIENGIER